MLDPLLQLALYATKVHMHVTCSKSYLDTKLIYEVIFLFMVTSKNKLRVGTKIILPIDHKT